MQRFVLEDHVGFEAARILGISEARADYGHQHISTRMSWMQGVDQRKDRYWIVVWNAGVL